MGPNTHAPDGFPVLPSGVQVDVRGLSPNAEDNAWRRPYPLGRTYDQRGRGHLGPADLHLVLVGGGLSRLWAGWQATQIIVQPRHSHRLAAHAVPRSWARLNQGGKPGQRAVAKYVRGFCRKIRFLGKIQKSGLGIQWLTDSQTLAKATLRQNSLLSSTARYTRYIVFFNATDRLTILD